MAVVVGWGEFLCEKKEKAALWTRGGYSVFPEIMFHRLEQCVFVQLLTECWGRF